MKVYKIIYEDLALEHISEIADWYENKKQGLGKEFQHELNEKVEKILTKTPKIIQIAYKNRRALAMKRFPHKIIYILNENKHEVQI
jgi:plasmid stabilization system protein ParE